ncbi:MAG: helix-turn-helix transcriptional regulator [Clostridia bacterium]|nr:helix-turn-helix transcriptional regulator [Clostridia bacterium]MBO5256152.1 helix-turn-helix transcriptional regulator [Clostridia bacterium]MBP3293764.1 helix-turn-helix transcriptional regulator [Clostridia bacterium]
MANRKEINPKTGPRLKEFIKELGITQEEFGEIIGLGARQISNIVVGNRRLTEENARRIVSVFSSRMKQPVRYEWLMGYDDCRTSVEYLSYRTEQLRDNLTKSFQEIEISKEKRYRAGKTLEALRMTLTENQEGLEELSCYSRVMGGKTADNIHTLNFLECIHEKGDSDAFQEYMAFYNGRMQTERAYIFFDETGENVRYMSEPEYWQFVDEICGYMDYVEYKAHQILKKKNSKEEQNG